MGSEMCIRDRSKLRAAVREINSLTRNSQLATKIKMQQFFKFLFASCLGTLLAIFAMTFIFGGLAASLGSKADKVKVKSNSVLKLTLSDPIPEKTNNMAPTGTFDFSSLSNSPLGLTDMVKTIEAAKEDDNIKGIYMELSQPSGGMATMSVLRDALEDFKDSGKFIVAHGSYYTQGGYYMASVADKVYLTPTGPLMMQGLSLIHI